MLRAVLMGALAVTAMASCSSKSDSPKVEPGTTAGKVVEVAGKVTVSGRALAIGDTVKSDDTIETGADGSVVIVLTHNDARWELGPNHKSKPTESLAWTAERASGPAKPVEQVTSAAGRPAERSAAETSTSSTEGKAEERADRNRAPAPTEAPTMPAPPPPPAAEPATELKGSRGIAPGGQGGGGVMQGKTEADAKVAPPPKPTQGVTLSIGAIEALTKCVPKGSKVTLNVHIAQGVPTIEFVGAADAKVKSCITTAAAKLKLPVESGDIERLELKR